MAVEICESRQLKIYLLQQEFKGLPDVISQEKAEELL